MLWTLFFDDSFFFDQQKKKRLVMTLMESKKKTLASKWLFRYRFFIETEVNKSNNEYIDCMLNVTSSLFFQFNSIQFTLKHTRI